MSTGRPLVESLLAVAGIWLVFRQLPDYAAGIYLAASGASRAVAGPDHLALQSVHFVVSALSGSFLVAVRKPIARWLWPGTDASRGNEPAMVAGGVAIIGVYFCVSGVVTLGTHYATYQSGTYLFWQGVFSAVLGASTFAATPWVARLWERMGARVERGA